MACPFSSNSFSIKESLPADENYEKTSNTTTNGNPTPCMLYGEYLQ
ncbi:hypothetical protein TNCT_583581, partial [Trichonephila clavata]